MNSETSMSINLLTELFCQLNRFYIPVPKSYLSQFLSYYEWLERLFCSLYPPHPKIKFLYKGTTCKSMRCSPRLPHVPLCSSKQSCYFIACKLNSFLEISNHAVQFNQVHNRCGPKSLKEDSCGHEQFKKKFKKYE